MGSIQTMFISLRSNLEDVHWDFATPIVLNWNKSQAQSVKYSLLLALLYSLSQLTTPSFPYSVHLDPKVDFQASGRVLWHLNAEPTSRLLDHSSMRVCRETVHSEIGFLIAW
ncbi:hypothetical protein QC760_007624 [Botrytis cinerea]